MKILDLFCGAGGASMCISLAGHTVEGVDINPQPDYPFMFYQDDARTVSLDGYDAYFASPPCQAYSYSTAQWRQAGKEYPDYVDIIRQRLLATGKQVVMENVVRSTIRKDIILSMGMFNGADKQYVVRRHRVFEIHGFTVPQPKHVTHKGHAGDGRVISVFGNGGGRRKYDSTCDLGAWRIAMNCPWMTKRKSLAEAIPPDYTQYIFEFLK